MIELNVHSHPLQHVSKRIAMHLPAILQFLCFPYGCINIVRV